MESTAPIVTRAAKSSRARPPLRKMQSKIEREERGGREEGRERGKKEREKEGEGGRERRGSNVNKNKRNSGASANPSKAPSHCSAAPALLEKWLIRLL